MNIDDLLLIMAVLNFGASTIDSVFLKNIQRAQLHITSACFFLLFIIARSVM